jgi:hypothetical protein
MRNLTGYKTPPEPKDALTQKLVMNNTMLLDDNGYVNLV